MRKLFLLSIAIMILFSFNSVSAYVYDDFSGSTLNLTKWAEEPASDISNQHVDEHYVNTTEQRYHTAQVTIADRGTQLKMINHDFTPGETLEFDTYYISGQGNRESTIVFDGEPLTIILHNMGCYWCGGIGYWDHLMSIGNDFGIYHYTINFLNDGANISVIRPDSTIWTTNISGFTSPYTFGVITRTGHNGLVHFDYDDFIINEFPPTITTTTTITTSTTTSTTTTIPISGCTVPHENSGVGHWMVIKNDTVFCPSVYNKFQFRDYQLSIDIIADYVTVDCAGAIFDGISFHISRNGVTLKNCNIKRAGIVIHNVNSSTITNNVISDGYIGIRLYGGDNHVITDNIITNHSNYGLTVVNPSGPTVSRNNTIVRNIIKDNYRGIEVSLVNYSYIFDNDIIHSTLSWAGIVTGSFGNKIWNNNLYGNSILADVFSRENNIFCVDGISNHYFEGATGPTCPTTTTTTSTTTTTIPSDLEERVSLLEYYVNLLICNLLPKGLRKGVTCPVY